MVYLEDLLHQRLRLYETFQDSGVRGRGGGENKAEMLSESTFLDPTFWSRQPLKNNNYH